MDPSDVQAVVEATWRQEAARIVASVARLVRDVGLAEELTQDVVVTALQRWPSAGVPDNPGGWLMHAARQHAIDHLRRQDRLARKLPLLVDEPPPSEPDDEGLPDDILRLIFTACHPALSTEAQVALTLRVVGGLTTVEIARAFLVPESTVAQRIVRAKRTLAEKQIPFETPDEAERPQRLASVLDVVYLIFNEGYTATGGPDWFRPPLCTEALRLGRLLADIAPDEPEVHGLLALMELQSSRLAARLDANGEPVPLLEQDRGRWDRGAIARGFEALMRAGQSLQPYVLQAAIAACHAGAHSPEETDWVQIVTLYEALELVTPTPVVRLNHAVAVSWAYGPANGLALVDTLLDVDELRAYHLLPAVRGDLLVKLGRSDEARTEFLRAADLTANERESAFLRRRAEEL